MMLRWRWLPDWTFGVLGGIIGYGLFCLMIGRHL